MIVRNPQGNDIEAKCLEIYARILNVSGLQAADDFIHAGGDSTKAVLIATELESTFDIEITMATFYQNRNVAEMTAWLLKALPQDGVA